MVLSASQLTTCCSAPTIPAARGSIPSTRIFRILIPTTPHQVPVHLAVQNELVAHAYGRFSANEHLRRSRLRIDALKPGEVEKLTSMRAVGNRHIHERVVIEPELDKRAAPAELKRSTHGHVVDALSPVDVVRARATSVSRCSIQLQDQVANGVEDLNRLAFWELTVTTNDLEVVWWRLRWLFRGNLRGLCGRDLGWRVGGRRCRQLKEVAVVVDEVFEERVVYSSRRERVITVRVELPSCAEAVGLQLDVPNPADVYTHTQ